MRDAVILQIIGFLEKRFVARQLFPEGFLLLRYDDDFSWNGRTTLSTPVLD